MKKKNNFSILPKIGIVKKVNNMRIKSEKKTKHKSLNKLEK